MNQHNTKSHETKQPLNDLPLIKCFVAVLYPQPVTVTEDISDQSTSENKSATFNCRIRINYPEITLTWYKGSQKLEDGEKYSIGSDGERHSLKIHDCQAGDQGDYRLVCGPHVSNAKLAVSGKSRNAPFT